jgi:uridine kinase
MMNMDEFTSLLFEKLKQVCPAAEELEPYEFQYCLRDLLPGDGWDSVQPAPKEAIQAMVESRSFYDGIGIKPRVGDRIVLDPHIIALAQMLFAGLASGKYEPEWVNTHFYFDLRGFFFLHRTTYFTDQVITHFGGEPFRQFEQAQRKFETSLEIGYKAFQQANAGLDACFIASAQQIIAARGTPALLAIAGPTAAGKTEIVERLRSAFEAGGQRTTSIELDNFLTDREYREQQGIFTQGKQALHFELLVQALRDITSGRKIYIPRYDFVYATSSHDLQGRLKPDGVPIEIEPADVVFIEGNFPFLIEELAELIDIKVVYLTDDPVRLKRKWRRDIDYRKKYEPTYFRNRYFKDQFIMAEIAYRPQLELCDLAVDTTGAALWATEEMRAILSEQEGVIAHG